MQAFVERLEQAAGSEAGDEPGSLPSGETIARDLQRFLRQRGDEPPGPGRQRRPARVPPTQRLRGSTFRRAGPQPDAAHRSAAGHTSR